MTTFEVELRVSIPNAVVANRRMAEDSRTADVPLCPNGGAERLVNLSVEADDRAAANTKAIALLRDVLGDVVYEGPWVEQTMP